MKAEDIAEDCARRELAAVVSTDPAQSEALISQSQKLRAGSQRLKRLAHEARAKRKREETRE